MGEDPAAHIEHRYRSANAVLNLSANHHREAAGVVATHLKAQAAARHADHSIKRSADNLEVLAGNKL